MLQNQLSPQVSSHCEYRSIPRRVTNLPPAPYRQMALRQQSTTSFFIACPHALTRIVPCSTRESIGPPNALAHLCVLFSNDGRLPHRIDNDCNYEYYAATTRALSTCTTVASNQLSNPCAFVPRERLCIDTFPTDTPKSIVERVWFSSMFSAVPSQAPIFVLY